MKILYVVDYYQPQFGYSEYFIPKILSEMGHTVWILTSNYYYPFPDYETTSGRLLGPRKQESGIFRQGRIIVIKEELKAEIFTRAVISHHERYVRFFKPDLVIVNKSAGYNVLRIAQLKKRYGYKLLSYDAHLPSGFLAVGNLYLKEVFYFLFRLFFARMLNKQVDTFVAVQEGTVEIMTKYYGQKNVIHIPLGTDTDTFYFSPKKREEIRTELKLTKDDFLIVYSGKVITTKGVDILFEAFNKLKMRYANMHLLIVGTGKKEYLDYCFSKVDSSAKKHISVVGFKNNNELYAYYSASEVGVWPLEESTSMNDIAACGRPFIANDTVGVSVRFSNNNAYKYRKGDANHLASVIEKLYLHPKLREEMGHNGYELIRTKLSWRVIVEKYLSYVV